jgi:hypothetical protein
MWNFKKANWPEFSKEVDDLVGDKDDNDLPYMLVTKLCDAISAKSAIRKKQKRPSMRNSRKV